MELCGASRLSALELVPQQLAEQVVVAVPLMPWVEGNQEVIHALEPVKHRPAVSRARDGVAQSRTEPVEHARVKQEIQLRLALLTEHLGCEIVDHPSIATSEGRDEAARILAPAHRQNGQIEAGCPTLRAVVQAFDSVGRQVEAMHVIEHRLRF